MPEQWSNESVALVKTAWVPDGANLDERYYEREIKVLADGAGRIAAGEAAERHDWEDDAERFSLSA
jgi:hypothetical protein